MGSRRPPLPPQDAELPLPGVMGGAREKRAAKRPTDDSYECPCHGLLWPTLADFDNHRKDER